MRDKLETVMFVEDDPDMFPLIELSLSQLGGLKAFGFMSGAEAIEAAAEINPQFILLDVMMPVMDGPTTLAKLREIRGFEGKPAAFLTAKVNPADVEYLRSLDVVKVFSKPFDPVSLPKEIRRLWAEFHQGGY
ncbi:response regulator [Lutimaribacter saemankumensis]|uniref:Response regulator receiver domain-containing protein n=1 Tax=Lutimaribacter saemankumensis TaxID=490829 RepID=A0A1G8K6X9_9RHOB|nr:response regulator [Lutimaribacter saemankumensis]SDI39198.1 Response regulator receiver domain-containing protein [Lutimaribacter saemankumensis]